MDSPSLKVPANEELSSSALPNPDGSNGSMEIPPASVDTAEYTTLAQTCPPPDSPSSTASTLDGLGSNDSASPLLPSRSTDSLLMDLDHPPPLGTLPASADAAESNTLAPTCSSAPDSSLSAASTLNGRDEPQPTITLPASTDAAENNTLSSKDPASPPSSTDSLLIDLGHPRSLGTLPASADAADNNGLASYLQGLLDRRFELLEEHLVGEVHDCSRKLREEITQSVDGLNQELGRSFRHAELGGEQLASFVGSMEKNNLKEVIRQQAKEIARLHEIFERLEKEKME